MRKSRVSALLVDMASSKRVRNDENTPLSFIDQSTPTPKRRRLKAQSVTLAEVKNIQQERAQRDKAAADVKEQANAKSRVERVLGSITAAGYETLYEFVHELLNVRDQHISSRVSKMLGQHGEAILNSICARQPDIVKQWAINISGEILAEEGQQLAKYLRPSDGQTASNLLERFSLERIMSEAKIIAPTLCQLLRQVATNEKPSIQEKIRKDRNLVSSMFIISWKSIYLMCC